MKHIIYIAVLVSLNFTALAKMIRVGRSERIQSIQQALKVAVAGDTVIVGAGIYREKNIIRSEVLGAEIKW